MSLPANSGERGWAIGAWVVAFGYYLSRFSHRWVPHDEGLIGQSADRILRGQIPHRDFEAMYTGLLEYMHAGAMAAFGSSLLTPRLVMLVVVAAWLPAVWVVAYRLVRSPAGASLLTVVALLVGPPNYPAALPSWYNLFFATWAILALLRWTDDRRARWLVVAGALAGLSTLFKVSGLYLLAGSLFFVLHEALRRSTREPSGPTPGLSVVGIAVGGLTLGLVGMEVALVRPQMGLATFVTYVLPTVCLGVALVWSAVRAPGDPSAWRPVARSWTLLVTGFALPVLPFLAWFAVTGGLDDLVRGVFVLPRLRFEWVASPLPPLSRTWGAPALAGLVLVVAKSPRWVGWAVSVLVAVGGAILLTRLDLSLLITIFDSLSLAVPVLALAGGAVYVAAARRSDTDPALLCVLWVLALTQLIRFPLAVPVYFTYVLPLVVLAAGGLLARAPAVARSLAVVVGVSYAAFFGMGPNRGGLVGAFPPPEEVLLGIERGRIMVPRFEAVMYGQMVEFLQETSRSPYTFAGPDAPEVYFLSGLRNPTRTLYDLFGDPVEDPNVLLDDLAELDVNVVVLNRQPRFSRLPASVVEALVATYPRGRTFGRFVVRWRD